MKIANNRFLCVYILALVLGLLPLYGCGGGGGGDGGEYDECQDPSFTTTAPLPSGCHPSAFSAIGEISFQVQGSPASIRMHSNGTLTGTIHSSDYAEAWQYCRVGTRPPNIAGRWVYTYNDELCLRFDALPGEIFCEDFSYPGISCGSSAKIAGASEGVPNENSSDVREDLEYLFEDILDSVLLDY